PRRIQNRRPPRCCGQDGSDEAELPQPERQRPVTPAPKTPAPGNDVDASTTSYTPPSPPAAPAAPTAPAAAATMAAAGAPANRCWSSGRAYSRFPPIRISKHSSGNHRTFVTDALAITFY